MVSMQVLHTLALVEDVLHIECNISVWLLNVVLMSESLTHVQ